MNKNQTKSNLRIFFASLALIAFVLFSLCDNLMVTEHTSYYTHTWRAEVMNDLFLSIPFVALLVFAVMERKLLHVCGSVFMAGLFVLYAVQTLFVYACEGTSGFSVLTCSWIGSISEVLAAVSAVRLAVLLLLPVAHKTVIKLYSLGMISFLGFFLIGFFTVDNPYFLHAFPQIAISLLVDILFHIALYFFGDLSDKKKKNNTRRHLPDSFWKDLFTEDDDTELDEP